jgi:hypothetical protein
MKKTKNDLTNNIISVKINLMKIFPILLVGVIFISCEMNKLVELSPIEPYEYIENNVIFNIKQIQKWGIYFQAPLIKKLPDINFLLRIMTNEKIENVYLKSTSLKIKDLDIVLNKENLMIPIPNRTDKLTKPTHNYWSYVDGGFFGTTAELLNEYNPNISLNKFYYKFNKVKEVEFCMIIVYEIDSNYYETELTWRYSSKKITSFAQLDAGMGI